MNYTTDYTVILTAIYILFIAIAYCPKSCKVETTENIQYFPDLELTATEPEPTEPIKPSPAPVGPIVSTAIATNPEPQKVTEPLECPFSKGTSNLALLSIRQLKKLASEAKIKRYNVMKKGELILALS